jgi:hypothetical protein
MESAKEASEVRSASERVDFNFDAKEKTVSLLYSSNHNKSYCL